jgi:DNA-binding transcriptional regulator YhcF (GntR family)
MDFRDNEAKYLQIAVYVREHILLGRWSAAQKIPSVRDMAVEVEVNPNTVMRAYEYLQIQGVIKNKRGLGLFVAIEAIKKIKAYHKEYFMQYDLPEFFRNIYLLEIELGDLQQHYLQFKTANYKNTTDQNDKKDNR